MSIGSVGSSVGTQRPNTSSTDNQYTVRSGDTMTGIARAHGVGVEDLARANPQVRDPSLIQPGQALNIPAAAPAGTTGPAGSPVAAPGAEPAARAPVSRDAALRNDPTAGAIRDRVQGEVPATQAAAPAAGAAPAGSVNERIAAAAEAYRGTSTRAGPDGGNLACAWAVNNVLQNAIGRKIGANTNYVPSVEAALRQQATEINPRDARPGDIVVAGNQSHIGIVVGDGRVLSNSSSRAAFRWESGMNFDGYYGRTPSRVYRLNE